MHAGVQAASGGPGPMVGKLVLKTDNRLGEFHGQMNAINLEKWIGEKLISEPQITSIIVFILLNVPYHRKQVNKLPCKSF